MSERRRLLILEDDPALSRDLATVFSDLDVTCSGIGEDALKLIRRIEPDVVLFNLGECNAGCAEQNLGLLRKILNLAPATKIVAVTGENGRDLAVKAVGLGATDFYHLPLNSAVLSIVVRRAFRMRELEAENVQLRQQTGSMVLEGIIGASDSMRALCRAVEKVAPTSATVLVLGESGTGKELVARALHRLSGRAQ